MFDSGFYNVGTLWAVLVKICFPHNNTFSLENYKFVNMITCLPSLIGVGLILCKTSESPLYLMSRSNKYDEAFILLTEMGKAKNIVITEEVKDDLKKEVVRKKNYKLESNFSELFYPEYRMLTLLCLLINSVCYLNMIGISYLVPKMIQESQANQILSENAQLIIFALIQIPNGPIGGLMTESHFFGRKKTIIVSSFFCTIFYMCIYMNKVNLCYYAGIIMFFNSIAFGCAFIYVSEVFPTNIRDQAQSFIQFLSFIFGSWSPYFIDYIGQTNLNNNNLYLAASCLLCIVLSVILPLDTLNRPLDDDL
jgi:sugar phosphate permease